MLGSSYNGFPFGCTRMKKRRNLEAIDRTGPIPLYEQIKSRLLGELKDASPENQARYFSDSAVMARFGVSRMTARNAIADLVRQGFIKRVPGRGTFVVGPPALALHLDGVERFMQDWHTPHLNPIARILTFRHMKATDEIAARLQIVKGSIVLVVRRVRHADGEPAAYDIRYVSGWCASGITRDDAGRRSLFASMEKHSGLRADAVEQEVSAIKADEQVARVLNIPLGSALLRRHVTFLTAEERPLLTGVSLYRSDLFSFQMRAAR